MKYCNNCEQMVEPTKGINWILGVFLLLLFFFPGLIYLIWAHSKGGKCPMCESAHWGIKPKRKRK